jgi:hypothetical protein
MSREEEDDLSRRKRDDEDEAFEERRPPRGRDDERDRPRSRRDEDNDYPRRRRHRDDDDDDDYEYRRRRDMGQDAGIRMLLPVGRSGWAIAAGYLGLISVLCVPGPFALLCGILAVSEIRRDPKKHGMGRAIFGIVMGTLGSIVLLIGLIVFISGR